MAVPTHVKYLVIGAGIHGLSTAYHLAENCAKPARAAARMSWS